MNNMSIFDIEEEKQKSIGYAGSLANPDWYSEAENAVMLLIRRGEDFTTDNVWRLLDHTGLKTPEPRAMGAVIQQFVKDKQIVSTGNYRKSTRPACHRRPLAVWRPVKQGGRFFRVSDEKFGSLYEEVL